MNYEQMYKEALERAKNGKPIDEVFPELKESEDERIRKRIKCALIEWNEKCSFPGDSDDMIAWFEKKGEQKSMMIQWKGNNLKEVIDFIGKSQNFDKWFKNWEDFEQYVHSHNNILKLFDEDGSHYEVPVGAWIVKTPDGYNVPSKARYIQKPADKVEQTFFKAGNWYLCVKDFLGNCGVRFDKGHVYHCGNDGCLQEFDSGAYIAIDERLFDYFNLWTIGDAKNGDVLAFYSEYRGNKMVQVGIIEKYVGKHGGCSNTFKIHVGVNWENNLQIGEYMGCSDIQPATQEQREFLFTKMKEAGYEWDAEKNVLKAIEKKPTDLPKGEDYGIDGLGNAITILEKTLGEVDGYQTDDGILEHKCAINAVKELYKKKSVMWSEEDELRMNTICELLDGLDLQQNWIKSLKDRVHLQSKQEGSEGQSTNKMPDRIRPKFSVGDTICRQGWSDQTIQEIYIRCKDPVYVCKNDEELESHILMSEQDEWSKKEQKSTNPTDLRTWKYIVSAVLTDWNGIGQYLDNPHTDKLAKKLQERFGNIKQNPVDDTWIEEYWKHHKVNNPDSYNKGDEIQFDYDGFKRFCGQFKQKPVEWNKEDSEMLNRIIMSLAGFSYFGGMEASYVVNWLKSLKPQNRWKPSEKQMMALLSMLPVIKGSGGVVGTLLESLYSDLQKL